MFKFFFPLKWSLAESLVKLAAEAKFQTAADQYEKTRITLLYICGHDPLRIPFKEHETLKNECGRLKIEIVDAEAKLHNLGIKIDQAKAELGAAMGATQETAKPTTKHEKEDLG